ncbi:T9SS C-terminal target domain-containing protein [Chryseobacterium sp. G0186]|nr:T9SS C-terminal target domain-containing protein [Chryseobacterium sp. G0186]
MNINDVHKGIYLLKITSDKNPVLTKKIIVE